ncbi:retrovirus-related pol polyprotein from transposon TNT 1-94, partial [Tanacetum coccineum]
MTEYSQKWHNGTSRTRSTKTSDGLTAIQAQLNNLGREIKKVNEKVYVAKVGCEQCKGPHYTKDCPLKEEGASIKTLEIQTGQISKVLQEKGFGSLPRSTEANPRDHVKLISTTVKADSNQIRRMGLSQYAVSSPQNRRLVIKSRQTTIPFPTSHIDNSIPRKEKDPGSVTLPCYINNVCFDNALADLGASVSVMPLSTYLDLGLGKLAHTKLTVELADRTVKYPKGIAENVLVGFGKFVFPIDVIILDIPKDVKVSLILEIPFLSTAYAKIDVFKRKITLRVGDEKIIFKSMKPASSLIKRVYMLSLRERIELDLEDRLMGETLVLNRSLDPLNGDYIELNDLNVPLELRRDQVDDLMPTIKEGEVVDAHMDDLVKTKNDELNTRINDYPGCCDYDKKIRIDCAHNLKFSCMIGFEFIHVNFFLILYVNVMSKKFYNSIMKDKLEYKGNNVLGALMSVPIFVGTFYVVTDFIVLEDMDAYRDEGIGHRCKEIDEDGEVSIIWNPMCDYSHAGI